jgi:hypothetical protein
MYPRSMILGVPMTAISAVAPPGNTNTMHYTTRGMTGYNPMVIPGGCTVPVISMTTMDVATARLEATYWTCGTE